MFMPTQLRVTEDRRQALLAATARAHLISAATRPSRSSTPPPAGRARAGLRHAVASLLGIVFVR